MQKPVTSLPLDQFATNTLWATFHALATGGNLPLRDLLVALLPHVDKISRMCDDDGGISVQVTVKPGAVATKDNFFVECDAGEWGKIPCFDAVLALRQGPGTWDCRCYDGFMVLLTWHPVAAMPVTYVYSPAYGEWMCPEGIGALLK